MCRLWMFRCTNHATQSHTARSILMAPRKKGAVKCGHFLNPHQDVVVSPEKKGVAHARVLSSICTLVRLLQGRCSSVSHEIFALLKNQCDAVRSFASHNADYGGILMYVGNSVIILTLDVESLYYWSARIRRYKAGPVILLQ